MPPRTVQLVLHYDGSRFAGWQRQPAARTVQGELEAVFEHLFGTRVGVVGAGRTDAGVHATGQAAHVTVSERWTPDSLRRAVNALLPHDVWVSRVVTMDPAFHARYSAVARRYTYRIGTDECAESPFRRPYEWHVREPLDRASLSTLAGALVGEHAFRGFAVRGTAPERDSHVCAISEADWVDGEGGLAFRIEANRFLHHMIRFLVGTMVEVATGRRSAASFATLLTAAENTGVSAPAPARGLCLEAVTYPADLYLEDA